mmetsp:Transcript_4817/g.18026  ORF Transcript_4817/g.18026 Transcript_4817/m.18026 type:complete len:202 (-) Transcript_4817:334-939(-)
MGSTVSSTSIIPSGLGGGVSCGSAQFIVEQDEPSNGMPCAGATTQNASSTAAFSKTNAPQGTHPKSPSNTQRVSSSQQQDHKRQLKVQIRQAVQKYQNHHMETSPTNDSHFGGRQCCRFSQCHDQQTEDFLFTLHMRGVFRKISQKTDPLFTHMMQKHIDCKMGVLQDKKERLGTASGIFEEREDFARLKASKRMRETIIR